MATTLYQRVLLSDYSQDGIPNDLPVDLQGRRQAELDDLIWTNDPRYLGYGYWPVTVSYPNPIPTNTMIGDTVSNVVIHPDTKTVTANADLVPRDANVPYRISKIDFSRLFTTQERAVMNAARATIRQMTAADYANPGLMGLVALEIIFDAFNLPAEFIELNNADTIFAIGTVLVQVGILTTYRADQILNNIRPS